MPGEALLIGIATMAVVIAGFTGVTASLVPPGGAWHPAMRIRQRAIVIWRGRQLVRAGGNRTRTAVALYALGPIATALFWANAVAAGSVAVYALALCIQLSVAVVSFYSLVSAAQN